MGVITEQDLKNRVYIRKGSKLEGLELDGCMVVFECEEVGTFEEMLSRTVEYASNCSFSNCKGTTAEIFAFHASKLALRKAGR